ncbi:hypothetical protein [Altererythrobacter lauratis]|uniref:PilZ domain-containing protein n=1 Tax=Alteraurantiacibacter lauratis TaxID=2054627 RepID=A0ABV7EIN3_9SPHN
MVAGKPRVEQRVRAVVRARLRDNLGERDICLIDISTRGLLATAARPPVRGDFVEIIVGRNRMTAQVKWTSERRFGLLLRERVSIPAMIEGGKASVMLAAARSATAVRGKASADWLNPLVLARAGQLGLMLLAVAGVGMLLTELVAGGLNPVREAVEAASH